MAIIVFQHSERGGPGRLGATLRDHGFKLDIRRLDLDGAGALPPDLDNVHGIISLGGPQNVGESHEWMPGEMALLKQAHERQLPVIGICLGAQVIAATLGGEVGPMEKPELGMPIVSLNPAGQIETMLAGIPWDCPQFSTHGYEVKKLPPGAQVFGGSKQCKVQVFRAGIRTYGFQYHPECDMEMIKAFAAADGAFLERAGMTAQDVLLSAERHYEMYARAADRLAVNLAAYLFPLSRKMTA
ncbi:type 1 glutamine amidotransferase [Nodularia spumigena]|uniref:type 1 glutamine amidotransferase n=1 Tax=Nodularia spumigena TaxID=70799 RepID=UPI002B1F1B6A|nr:type 1 glutamine amidotransferase [Nodularia spumigena]MEA5557637.1 type 1 glutamine amidotransferase [Nodularia spumigena CH309]